MEDLIALQILSAALISLLSWGQGQYNGVCGGAQINSPALLRNYGNDSPIFFEPNLKEYSLNLYLENKK